MEMATAIVHTISFGCWYVIAGFLDRIVTILKGFFISFIIIKSRGVLCNF